MPEVLLKHPDGYFKYLGSALGLCSVEKWKLGQYLIKNELILPLGKTCTNLCSFLGNRIDQKFICDNLIVNLAAVASAIYKAVATTVFLASSL